MTTAYSWEETFAIEREGERVLDAVFGATYIIVRATREHQRQKIDRFHIHRTDGRIIHRVDYKIDRAAARFGNLALEHVSVRRGERVFARGWVHTSFADLYVSYVPAWDIAYVLPVERVRSHWDEIQRLWPLKHAQTKDERGCVDYFTDIYAPPIAWLKEQGIIERELLAVGAQLRLPLRAPRK